LTDAKILRGQRAWGKIKATAQEQRELWREVGEALLVGRRIHKSNQAFGKWLVEYGFDDIKYATRADSMWLAEQDRAVFQSLDNEITHPVAVRQWHRENVKPAYVLPLDLADLNATPVPPTVQLDTRSAERIAKTIHRSKSNNEGADAMWLASNWSSTVESLDSNIEWPVRSDSMWWCFTTCFRLSPVG
jgi:hypothetical protein